MKCGGALAASRFGIAIAREVDQILAAASQPVPPPGAASRLADIARATPQNIRSQGAADPVHVLGIGKFATVAILAASLMFGVYVGTLDTIEFDPFANEEEDVASLFEDPFGFESLEEEGGEGSG